MRIDAILLAALVAALPLSAFAQAAPTDAEKKAAAAKKDAVPAPAKDAKAPPKDAKAPPKDAKAPPKDAKAPPKAPPKGPPKAPPKADPKKAAPAKDAKKGGTEQVNPNVTIYRDAKDAPVARDKQGNVIPTSPDAYDVSSATKK